MERLQNTGTPKYTIKIEDKYLSDRDPGGNSDVYCDIVHDMWRLTSILGSAL